MNNIILKLLALFLFVHSYADEISLSFSKADKNIRNFRIFSDILKHDNVSHSGVEGKRISGSGQFSTTNILKLPLTIEGEIDKIILVDLRQESHGFMNTMPIAWKTPYNRANIDKMLEEILVDEETRLQQLLEMGFVETYPVYEVATEKEVAILNNFKYVRLPTLDHSYPSDEYVEDFVRLVKENSHSWLHVHCAAGLGRTTLFLSMFDMINNAKEISFDAILERQKAIGGQDLKKCLHERHSDAKKQNLYLERLNFLKTFYEYCRDARFPDLLWKEYNLDYQDKQEGYNNETENK